MIRLQLHRMPLAIATLLVLLGCAAENPNAVANPDVKSEEAPEHPANRLADETSPYLLLHAHNPVDWYPWGPEAFAKAKAEDKPIFLSIGYSSCYWCHVMERLVFENPEIASYMNEHFVSIKVDREERPDIDDIYMTSLQVYFQAVGVNQAGGWPLSMFLTPDAKPFVGGTYFPPDDKQGRVGFPTVMRRIDEIWQNERKQVQQNADILTSQVRRVMKPGIALEPVSLEPALVEQAVNAVIDSYDEQYGGVDFNASNADAPKFPVPVKLALLQHDLDRRGNEQVAAVIDHTLERIAAGGIHDHLGGGFHRYSTDRRWHVPHFEKMLYDQAQLVGVFAAAFKRTDNPRFREAAEDILDFVLREMTDAGGAFYSALDAETDGIEGEFYVWSKAQIEEILGPDDSKLFGQVYGLESPQVFEHGYVLHLPKPIDELADQLQQSSAELSRRLEAARKQLLEVRNGREPLLRDDKVLTSWNGLMIRGFADAGRILQRDDYIQAAERATNFVLANMRDDEGKLQRTYRDGQSKLNAYLDDYAFFVEALLSLHKATGKDEWLQAAQRMTDEQIDKFWDESAGGFFFTSHGHEELIVRMKNAYDAVIPSGNSTSVRNLIRLAELTGEDAYRDRARQTLEVFASNVARAPTGMTNMAIALGEYLGEGEKLALAQVRLGGKGADDEDILQVGAESVPSKDKNELVRARAYFSVDKLPAGATCEVIVLLNVQKGWHVNANPAQPDFLIPTTFTMTGKHKSKLTNVRYPKGHDLTIPGFDEPLKVYEKVVPIRATIEVPKNIRSSVEELELQIRYQACNDERCLRPTQVVMTGKLPVARAGEPVKRINDKLFPVLKTRQQ